MNNPRLLVIGPCRHGKDTVAEMLSKRLNLKFESSSLAALDVIQPLLTEVTGITCKDELFAKRHESKFIWKEAISLYNAVDKTALANLIFKHRNNDIYVGMRKLDEFRACEVEWMFDEVIYVDASKRVTTEGTTLEIPIEPHMHVIDNNHGIKQLSQQVDSLVSYLSNRYGGGIVC